MHDPHGGRLDLIENTIAGDGARPPEIPDPPGPVPAAPGPDHAGEPGQTDKPAGLLEQARRTVDAGRRLVTTHIDLAKAELAEIAERAKVAAALIGIAVALVLFVAILVPVGTALFVGEWLFGSIGWGVLHGLLVCLALVVVLLLRALEIPGRSLTLALLGAAVLGIAMAVVLGLAWPNQLFGRVGDSLIPGVDPAVRPLVAGLGVGALVIGVLGLVVGARVGGAGGAFGGLIGGAVLGVLVGAFLAISFSRHVGVAIGLCVTFIAWPALAAAALRTFDWPVLKARYWPGTTIETTKETIEWVRARTPRGRKP